MNRKLLLLSVLCLISFGLMAQTQKDLRLNEVMITNVTGMVDDYGVHNGWIEVFNVGYGTVDMGGCYLTNDPSNLKKYVVPFGDVLTKIRPRQHSILWADNIGDRGTFHLNFDLRAGDEILLISSDGITILDRITLPEVEPDQSYGRLMDGEGSHGPESNGEGWSIMERATPSTNNHSLSGETKSAKMARLDPYGWLMAITAMSVVFCALILLFFAFKGIGKASLASLQKKADKHEHSTAHDVAETSGETYAAIAMAIHQYLTDDDSHDVENTILTIDQIRRRYSPWSSKIYTLRQMPRK